MLFYLLFNICSKNINMNHDCCYLYVCRRKHRENVAGTYTLQGTCKSFGVVAKWVLWQNKIGACFTLGTFPPILLFLKRRSTSTEHGWVWAIQMLMSKFCHDLMYADTFLKFCFLFISRTLMVLMNQRK